MTVGVEFPTVEYVAFGATGPFTFTFLIGSSLDLNVFLDGVLQSQSSYSVDVNADQDLNPGGDVLFLGPVYAPTVVTIDRNTVVDQQVDYTPYDAFPAETHEGALDKLTIIAQDHEVELSRAIKAKPNDDGTTDYTFPDYDAGKGLMWDEATKSLTNSNDKFNDIVSDAAASAAAAAVSEGNAATSAGNAAVSEGNALASEVNALASENKANLWAEELEDVEVEPGEFSAFHWAKKAEDVSQLDQRYLRKEVDDTTIGNISMDSDNPRLTMNLDTAKGTSLGFSLIIDGALKIWNLYDYLTKETFYQIRNGPDTIVIDLVYTDTGEMDLRIGTLMLAGQDIDDRFLRKDVGDTTVGDITISKVGPSLILKDSVGVPQLVWFSENSGADALLDNNATRFGIFKEDSGGVVVAGLELSAAGDVDVTVGSFQLGGSNIYDLFLRKTQDDFTSGNITIQKAAPVFALTDLNGSMAQTIDFYSLNVKRAALIASFGDFRLRSYAGDGSTVNAELNVSQTGDVDVTVGTFKLAGQNIDDRFLRKDVDDTTIGNIFIDSDNPRLTMNLDTAEGTSMGFSLVIDGALKIWNLYDSLAKETFYQIRNGAAIKVIDLVYTDTGEMDLRKGKFQIASVDQSRTMGIGEVDLAANLLWGQGVLSIAKQGTGTYQVIFSSTMPSSQFVVSIMCNGIGNYASGVQRTTTYFTFRIKDNAGADTDDGFTYRIELY